MNLSILGHESDVKNISEFCVLKKAHLQKYPFIMFDITMLVYLLHYLKRVARNHWNIREKLKKPDWVEI